MPPGTRGHVVHRKYKHGVTLVGGGPLSARVLSTCLTLAPTLVAADGGADQASAHGRSPDLIIGDLDSLVNQQTWRDSGIQIIECVEQETTDFEKCLSALEAPFFLGCGFLGGRLDHQLAALSALLADPRRKIVLTSETELCFLCPDQLELQLPIGAQLSLMPLCEVRGTASGGLQWPIDDLVLRPGGRTGPSNRVTGPVKLAFDRPGVLVVLEVAHLGEVVAQLTARD